MEGLDAGPSSFPGGSSPFPGTTGGVGLGIVVVGLGLLVVVVVAATAKDFVQRSVADVLLVSPLYVVRT